MYDAVQIFATALNELDQSQVISEYGMEIICHLEIMFMLGSFRW